MKKIVAVIIMCLLMISGTVECLGEENLKESELYAKSAVLMDGDSGEILYEKNGHEAMANASTTKILTCIITLEKGDLDSVVEASSRASAAPRVRLGMKEGQKFYLKDLLYGLMLESYNDCAVAIAEHLAGTTEDFAKLMNAKAKEIGCKDTYFITPNGLDATDENGFHHTTAADLALIMRYCIQYSPMAESFLEITRTPNYTISEINNGSTYSCYNHNAFLQMMDGALSGKTGFTGNAGYCYVGAVQRDGKTYIAALLACGWPNNKTYKWSDMKKIVQYGIDNFYQISIGDVAIDELKLSPLLVEDGQGEGIGLDTYVDLQIKEGETPGKILLKNGVNAEVNYQIAPKLTAPVTAGTYVGKITISASDKQIWEYQIVTKNGVEKIDFKWCFEKVWEVFTDYGKYLKKMSNT